MPDPQEVDFTSFSVVSLESRQTVAHVCLGLLSSGAFCHGGKSRSLVEVPQPAAIQPQPGQIAIELIQSGLEGVWPSFPSHFQLHAQGDFAVAQAQIHAVRADGLSPFQRAAAVDDG